MSKKQWWLFCRARTLVGYLRLRRALTPLWPMSAGALLKSSRRHQATAERLVQACRGDLKRAQEEGYPVGRERDALGKAMEEYETAVSLGEAMEADIGLSN